MSGSPPSRRRILAKIVLMLTSLAVAATAVELVFWVVLGHRPPGYKAARFHITSPLTGHLPRPRATGDHHRYHDGARFRVQNNGWGFTDDDWTLHKTRPRLALIGDSLVASWEAGPDHRLDDALEEALDHRFEVLNMGVRSFGTDQTVLLFEEVGVHFAPDVVVYEFCINDLRNNVDTTLKPYFVVDESTDALQLQGYPVFFPSSTVTTSTSRFVERSFFYRRVERFVTTRIWDPPSLERNFELRPYRVQYDQEDERRWTVTLRLIDRLASFAESRGMKFLLVEGPFAPTFDPTHQDQARSLYGDVFDFERVERRLESHARTRGLRFLSLNAALRDAGTRAGEIMHPEDKMHVNAAGSARIAEFIARALNESPKVESAERPPE